MMTALFDRLRALWARIRRPLTKSPARGGGPGEEGTVTPKGSGGPGPFVPPKSK